MRIRAALGAAGLLSFLLVFAGGQQALAGSGAQTIPVTLTNDGCQPASIQVPPGTTTFSVTNQGASGVTEMEILSGSRILSEVENVNPGQTGSFTLNLQIGTFTINCPGGSTPHGVLTVTNNPSPASTPDDGATPSS